MDENNNMNPQTPEQQSGSNFEQPNFEQPSFEQPNYSTPTYQPEQSQDGKGLAIASMVCGIASLVICCFFVYGGLALAIVGLVLGIIALVKKTPARGMAIAGIVTGAITLILAIVVLIIGVAGLTYLQEMGYDINSLG